MFNPKLFNMKKTNFEKKLTEIREKAMFEIAKFWSENNIMYFRNKGHYITHTVLDAENMIQEFNTRGILLSNGELYDYDHTPIEDLIQIIEVLRKEEINLLIESEIKETV